MWPTAVQNHFNSGLPWRHDWAIYASVKRFSDNGVEKKGIWTGDYDLTTTAMDGTARLYEGAQAGLSLSPIRYRIGTFVMTQEAQLALTPEGKALVQDYNTFMAPVDLYCLVWNPTNMSLLGVRRFFKGFIEGARIVEGAKEDADTPAVDKLLVKMVSIARKGVMTTTGKKSNESQKKRLSTDTFRKYSDLGTVSNDPWGVAEED